MIHTKYNIIKRLQLILSLLFLLLLSNSIWAEGSKDLYPANARGGRAWLNLCDAISGVEASFSNEYFRNSYPSSTATHYVYAEEGEQIAIATDVQANGKELIMLYSPDGFLLPLNLIGEAGNIPNRTAELAGPRLPNQGAGDNRYLPVYYTVPQGESGIYKVEFIGSKDYPVVARYNLRYTSANAWPSRVNDMVIAWDITVAKRTGQEWNWVNGRVYANMLRFQNGINVSTLMYPPEGFYGKFKVLTYDGYVYHIEHNGQTASVFAVAANNIGTVLTGANETSIYESYRSTSHLLIDGRYRNPSWVDTRLTKAFKVFYNTPDVNLPTSAKYAVTGQSHWLKNKEPDINQTTVDFKVVGVEAGENIVGPMGAYVSFTIPSNCTYKITIKPKAGVTPSFPVRILQGTCQLGENRIYWDGKDGQDKYIMAGTASVSIELNYRYGEIHVPLFAPQRNPSGLIVELLSSDYQSVRSDKVYWDDRPVDTNPNSPQFDDDMGNPMNASHVVMPQGISSRVNGHIFTRNSVAGRPSGGTLGALSLMNTWAFAARTTVTEEKEIEMKVADLEVVSIIPDQTSISQNEIVTYAIKVKNNGPSAITGAPFTFVVPLGFESVQTQFTGNSCGTESSGIVYDALNHIYRSTLDLANGCEVTYNIQLKAIAPVSGLVKVEATILRPNGIYDPDATNTNPNVPPTDPYYECTNNGLGRPCNNIKKNEEVVFSSASFTLIKDGVWNATNGSTAQVGDAITYTIQLTNTGVTQLGSVVLTDPLLGGVVTAVPVKSVNVDNVLDVNESWTYTLTYALTQADLANKGVYNQASVKATETGSNIAIEKKSKPTVPLLPTDLGYDPLRPNHTFVPLSVNSILISNPMVRQRIK
ncbi:DUF11 domain-containing protein [Myroides sp. 1354]|uniref:DUF7507 domain-containing protein n=1 Tax=unclassified Myroides TaxID=2642485 RepID=UPI00257582AC|nr:MULTISPECIES: hypothetical protein [unclassified Myroides]MDM1046452.1 DUF11 domain-containing protein [Myroides sp. R163-1]MDM1057389.1 DUF11 domain-containing protein [Myroides sp. 1354]MDM1070598.1 DUF11 domain-containing protein [Myroides sp. 1372]